MFQNCYLNCKTKPNFYIELGRTRLCEVRNQHRFRRCGRHTLPHLRLLPWLRPYQVRTYTTLFLIIKTGFLDTRCQCSGSADPCLWLMDPDPFYFRHWPSRCQQKTNLKKQFFCIILFEGIFTSFFKGRKSQNSRNQGVSYYFCLMIEGSEIQEAQKHVDPVDPDPDLDPDPQHWRLL